MRKFFLFFLLVLPCIFSFSGYLTYYGNLHAHTSYSDGVMDPWYAFDHAKNIGKVDVQAVTDHGYYLRYPMADGSMRYPKILNAANESTREGEFLAIGGFEWTLTGPGHIVVYDTEDYTDRNESDLYQLYDWLYKRGGIGLFAHPGVKYGDFFDFEYSPKADQVMQSIELGNGSGSIARCINDEYYDRYKRALSRGWHVGAAANQDNHQANWGSGNSLRTGILMEEFTLAGLYRALRARHTFATEDSDAQINLYTDEALMGDVLYDRESVTIHVDYVDTGEPVKAVQIVTRDRTIELPVRGDEWKTSFVFAAAKPYEWVFVRVEQYDGNEIITSPIWVQDSKKVYIFNTYSFPTRIVRNQVFKYGYEIANMNEEERVIDFDIKTKEGEILYHKTVTLQGLELFKEVIDLKTPTIDLGLYLDAELYENAGLREVAFIAGIDTSHENYYLSELSPMSAFLNLLGGEIVPIKGSLNAAKIGNCSWLIVPLPPSDAMMPSFTVLTLKDIELLTDYTKRGGNFIFILSQEGSPKEALESFEQFIQETGVEVTFADSGLQIVGTKKLFETPSGTRLLFLTWKEATDPELSKEILSTYRFLWETEP